MADKKILIICNDDNAVTLLNSLAQKFLYQTQTIIAQHEIQHIYINWKPSIVILDLNFANLDSILLINYLANIQCSTGIILIGNHEERLLLAIKHVGETKGLNITAAFSKPLHENELNKFFSVLDSRLPHKIDANKIAQALEDNRFTMYYQPKINVKSKKLLGLEALIRWRQDDGEMLAPTEFIPVAEESGLIAPLTHWVIRKVFDDCSKYYKTKVPVQFALNLSSKMLSDLVFPSEVAKIAEEFEVDPKCICFEITETGVSHQSAEILEVLTHLRVLGFSLSIDDFGTGYSSIAELQRLPFTELKIDKSFVFELAHSSATKTIVRSTIELGHNLNMELVAEGVETIDAMKILENLGCDIMQGYLISKPLSLSDLDVWCQHNLDKNSVWLFPK